MQKVVAPAMVTTDPMETMDSVLKRLDNPQKELIVIKT
jgi:hypothetical protein